MTKLLSQEAEAPQPSPPPSKVGREVVAQLGRQGRVCEAGEQRVTSSLGRSLWEGAMAWHVQKREFLLLNCDFCPSADSHLNKDSRRHCLP